MAFEEKDELQERSYDSNNEEQDQDEDIEQGLIIQEIQNNL